jgi:hypothetical protein
MAIEHLPHSADSPPNIIFESRERRTVASYERELKRERIRHRRTETELREALAQEDALLHQKDELIRQQHEILSQESDHQAVERPANDRKPALTARPGVGPMLKLLRNWPPRPIVLPRSGASTGVSTHWTAYKPLRSSNTSRTFVATSP